jgi:hypothetical protein
LALVVATAFHQIEVYVSFIFLNVCAAGLTVLDLLHADIVLFQEAGGAFLNALIVQQKVSFFTEDAYAIAA